MTAPDRSSPDGSQAVGAFAAWQATTAEQAQSDATAGVVDAYTQAQNVHRTMVRDPIDNNYVLATSAKGSADIAVTTSQAAANLAASADSTAASASARASYWEAEFVVASAEVLLGVNELLIGLCQNVPGGLTREITDMHVALLTQPGGMSFELKKWDATGTTATVLDTYTLSANTTRANWNTLGFFMSTRERVFINVTSVTGTTAPTVLQILLFGVMS